MPRRKPTAKPDAGSVPDERSAAPAEPRKHVTVLNAEMAAALVESMAGRSADRCALCTVPFTDEIPAKATMFGPYKAHLCPECKQRYGRYRVVGRI
jgi:hypothetical protein